MITKNNLFTVNKCIFTTLKSSPFLTKSFSGNDYIDKIKIKTKHGGVSIESSWLLKTFIDVFLSKNFVKKANTIALR